MNRVSLSVALGALALCLLLRAEPAAAPAMSDIVKSAPGVVIDLRYATAENFFRRQFYEKGTAAMLRPVTAIKLAAVQADLAARGLALKVWDAWRPLRVQREMWKVMPDSRYVANPANGSRHNRGAAVDVTLTDKDGRELEMPTAFDDFTEKAHAGADNVSAAAKKNRALLREVMERHGFVALATEWWHFDDAEWKRYGILE